MTVQVYLTIVGVVLSLVSIISVITSYRVLRADYSEKLKQDVSFSQMTESEQKIQHFIKSHNTKNDNAIAQIAKQFNVTQGGDEAGLASQAYLKAPNWKKEQIVVFKPGLSQEEKRFAYAHEIAHLMNGDLSPATRPFGQHKPEIEQRADYVAAALLMPLEEVYECLIKTNYADITVRQRKKVVRHLSKTYGVTEIVALRRIREVYILKNKGKD